MKYEDFLGGKAQLGGMHGFEPLVMPDFLFPFQRDLVTWAVQKGRAAIFADCGMGKTPMQLAWAQNVVERYNKPVLILTPLAVSAQTMDEAAKFGFDCRRSRDGSVLGNVIHVSNYEQLGKFDPSAFAGVVCDESSILKNFDGARRGEITAFMRKMPCRLLATATAAPNDYVELGTSSEALGNLGHMDMLNRYFKNDMQNSATGRQWGEVSKWRFKGHAETPFWRWVCSWARAVRKPSDLGYPDGDFILPPLVQHEHTVKSLTLAEGMLFELPAVGLDEQREELRRTIRERCERAAELADTKEPVLLWCHLNDEGDLLEDLIPGAVQVSGSDSEEVKEQRLLGFAKGEFRVLVTKPKIGAWGMNYQRCAHVVMFPSHSFEQFYQGVRRCWRFGQKRSVVVDMVATEGQAGVLANLQRKAANAERMFAALVDEMNHAISLQRDETFNKRERVPTWFATN